MSDSEPEGQHAGTEPQDVKQSTNVVSRISNSLTKEMTIGDGLTLLIVIGSLVVLIVLACGTLRTDRLGISKPEYARGLITLIFAGGTMLIAVLLAVFAITSTMPALDERFTRGKEVLTLLIGVFGTILGFYFGKAETPVKEKAEFEQMAPNDLGSTAAKAEAAAKTAPPKTEAAK